MCASVCARVQVCVCVCCVCVHVGVGAVGRVVVGKPVGQMRAMCACVRGMKKRCYLPARSLVLCRQYTWITNIYI